MRSLRDNSQYQRVPRTMNEAFGPYAKLHVARRKSNAHAWAWAIGYGFAVGVFLWLVVAIRAGA